MMKNYNISETKKTLLNPKIGDLYTEMYYFYAKIIGIKNKEITVQEWTPYQKEIKIFSSPCKLEKHFAYGSIKGYWVRLIAQGKNKQ